MRNLALAMLENMRAVVSIRRSIYDRSFKVATRNGSAARNVGADRNCMARLRGSWPKWMPGDFWPGSSGALAACAMLLLAGGIWAQSKVPIRLGLAPEEQQAALLLRVELWGRYAKPTNGQNQFKGLPPARPSGFGLTAEELRLIVPIARSFRSAHEAVRADLVAARGNSNASDVASARRAKLIVDAMADVRKALPAAAWDRMAATLAQTGPTAPSQ